MKTKITVITDNTPGEGLKGEWGLSLLIQYGDIRILADAGASALFLENLKGLGESAEEIDFAVLSHAHYDHAGGMPVFFGNNQKARLFVNENTAEDCYKRVGLFPKYIGIPRRMLKDYKERIHPVSGTYKICEGAFLVPHRQGGFPEIGRKEKMLRRKSLSFKPDDFTHEQSLVLETEKGLLIINGCSHGGVVNIIREVEAAFPERKIYGYIGGFHLFNKTGDEVRNIACLLKETGLEYICTGHCTGEGAFALLKESLGDKLHALRVGYRMEI